MNQIKKILEQASGDSTTIDMKLNTLWYETLAR